MSQDEQSRTEDTKYDVVIIGSGMGALSTGAVLSKLYGKRVLLLERHFKPGGLTHIFKRPGGYTWDVGVHYVGGMHEESGGHTFFDYISDGKQQWTPISDPFDKVRSVAGDFDQHSGRERLAADLTAKFPHEASAIRRYFKDIKRASLWMIMNGLANNERRGPRAFLRLAAWPKKALALQTTKEYIDQHFSDDTLKALVTAQWGLHGLPPSLSAFGTHAMLVEHYIEGAYYPAGGAGALAENIIPVIERGGGKVLTGKNVTRIEVEGGRATGVYATNSDGSETFYGAETVVSDAGAWNTYSKLLPSEVGAEWAAILRPHARVSRSTVSIFLGLKSDPRSIGVHGENFWLADHTDHEKLSLGHGVVDGAMHAGYLSFPSLKNPSAEAHTACLLTFVDPSDFEAWSGTTWKKRGDDYAAAKERIAEGGMELLRKFIPELVPLIDFVEVSTPLTSEFFTDAPQGAPYGLPGTPARWRERWISARTPVKNLYLTGADAMFFGVLGAAMSGAAAAGLVAGSGMLGTMMGIHRAMGAQRKSLEA